MATKNQKSEVKTSSSAKATEDKQNSTENVEETASTKTSSRTSKKTNPQTMDELLEMTGVSISGFKKGTTVTGIVTRVSPREILIDIGGKSEGVVIDREMSTFKDVLMKLNIGDEVTAQVIVEENDRGQSVLSLRRSIFDTRWAELDEKNKQKESVEVVVRDIVRGGVLVDFGGLRGYIPLSQLDTSISRLGEKASGRTVEANIIEVDRENNRLVLSQRAASEAAAFAKQKGIISELKEGQIVEATITGVVPFGAFAKIDVEKDGKTHEVEGLIHISEIAWEKVENPEEHVKQGDTVKVKIIGLEHDTGKVTLSLKQLMPDPWEDVLDVFEKDTSVKGTVTRVTPYGIFVSLSPGIEGLIHISKITPGEEPKQGEEISCIIEDIQAEKRKISLTPALTEKPIGYR